MKTALPTSHSYSFRNIQMVDNLQLEALDAFGYFSVSLQQTKTASRSSLNLQLRWLMKLILGLMDQM